MDWAGRVVLAGSLRAEGLASEVLSFGSPTERPQSAASMPSRYAADNDTGGWAVVAGTTDDKQEVAGRVAWSGTGINLRTGTPTPGRLRRAVRSALADLRYRIEAARLRREIIAAGDHLVTVADTMESLMSGNAGLVVSDGILDEGERVLAVR